MSKQRRKLVAVVTTFDGLQAGSVRFLQECSKLGELHVLLWSDEAAKEVNGKRPRVNLADRLYLLRALRYVSDVKVVHAGLHHNMLSRIGSFHPDIWAVTEDQHSPGKQVFCRAINVEYRVIRRRDLQALPAPPVVHTTSTRRKVVVSGSFDGLHSGHVQFLEQVSRLGDLYALVGSDHHVRLLKGKGHPVFSQPQRRYVVGAVRCVQQALGSTGRGWLGVEPEIDALQPDLYVVPESAHHPQRHAFCAQRGVEYLVLQRHPAVEHSHPR